MSAVVHGMAMSWPKGGKHVRLLPNLAKRPITFRLSGPLLSLPHSAFSHSGVPFLNHFFFGSVHLWRFFTIHWPGFLNVNILVFATLPTKLAQTKAKQFGLGVSGYWKCTRCIHHPNCIRSFCQGHHHKGCIKGGLDRDTTLFTQDTTMTQHSRTLLSQLSIQYLILQRPTLELYTVTNHESTARSNILYSRRPSHVSEKFCPIPGVSCTSRRSTANKNVVLGCDMGGVYTHIYLSWSSWGNGWSKALENIYPSYRLSFRAIRIGLQWYVPLCTHMDRVTWLRIHRRENLRNTLVPKTTTLY
jgi:hypothetical protein